MAPIPQRLTPRIVVYHQTHHTPKGDSISILPLITTPNTTITHLILAALHLNDPPGNITLNDHPPTHPRNLTLWAESSILQASGVKVMGMLGGAAKGSFTRLDLDDNTFEMYYCPLRDLIREKNLDGLDLDVEEPMTLAGIIRLIDRLKADLGESFLITLAPVAPALYGRGNLSGFDYEALEVMRGTDIAWYNAQFYCGWGDVSNTSHYDRIITRGFHPSKVVLGMVTNPQNGSGWVPLDFLKETLLNLRNRYGAAFGGVMGWEYFNSMPGDQVRPWEWATLMTFNVMADILQSPDNSKKVAKHAAVTLPLGINDTGEAPLPKTFEYFSEGSTGE